MWVLKLSVKRTNQIRHPYGRHCPAVACHQNFTRYTRKLKSGKGQPTHHFQRVANLSGSICYKCTVHASTIRQKKEKEKTTLGIHGRVARRKPLLSKKEQSCLFRFCLSFCLVKLNDLATITGRLPCLESWRALYTPSVAPLFTKPFHMLSSYYFATNTKKLIFEPLKSCNYQGEYFFRECFIIMKSCCIVNVCKFTFLFILSSIYIYEVSYSE